MINFLNKSTIPKICYILPEYNKNIDSHFYHLYEFLEEVSKKADLFLIVEKSDSQKIELGNRTYVQRFRFMPLRFMEIFLVILKARLKGYKNFYTHYAYNGAVSAAIVCRIFGGRSFYWNCAMNWLFKQRKLAGLGYRLSLSLSTFLVTGGEIMKQGYAEHYGLNPEKIKVMPNWINLKRFNRRNTQMDLAPQDTQKHAEESEFLYSDITYKIRGACFKIWKEFRGAFKEKVIERALAKELQNQGLTVDTQKQISVFYDNETIGKYVPDMIVNDKVLVELKSKTFLTKEDEKQFWLYLKGSRYRLGLLINFGKKLEIRRKVYDTARNNPASISVSPKAQDQRVSAKLPKVILFVHWLSKRKGADMIVPTIKHLLSDFPSFEENLRLKVIGDGPYKETLIEEIKDNKLEKFIEVLGGISNKDIVQYYQKANIFFMPSMEEGFPRVLLEAMAMGVPYVASEVGSVREISCETAQRFLVKSGDVAMFAHKIEALISDKETYEKFRQEELEKVQEYSLEKVIDKFINIISESTN